MRLVKLNSLEEKKQGLYKKQIAMTVIHVVKQLTMYLIILINEKTFDKEVSILKIPKSNLKRRFSY